MVNCVYYYHMKKALIFDFYGVICNEIGTWWYKNIPPSELVPELKINFDAPSDTGEISDKEFFAGIAGSIGLTGEEVRTQWSTQAKIDTELIKFIKKIKSSYKIAICSNTISDLFYELLDKNEIRELFDVIVASSEVGMVKPNADIYNYTLVQLNIEANEAIFVDDRLRNIDGARAVGIDGVIFCDTKTLIQDLNKLGVVE